MYPTGAIQKKVYEKVYRKMTRNNLSLLILFLLTLKIFLALKILHRKKVVENTADSGLLLKDVLKSKVHLFCCSVAVV